MQWSARFLLTQRVHGRSSPASTSIQMSLISKSFETCQYSPQVRCALWQAKHALRAFFRLGLVGSLSFTFEVFEPLVDFRPGEPSPECSVRCSAAMSSSKSALYSGEGDASSGSGVVIISLCAAHAEGRARMLLCCAMRLGVGACGASRRTLSCGCSRQWIRLGCSQQNGSANV